MSIVELNTSVHSVILLVIITPYVFPLVLPLCFLYYLDYPSHGLSNKVSGFSPPQILESIIQEENKHTHTST